MTVTGDLLTTSVSTQGTLTHHSFPQVVKHRSPHYRVITLQQWALCTSESLSLGTHTCTLPTGTPTTTVSTGSSVGGWPHARGHSHEDCSHAARTQHAVVQYSRIAANVSMPSVLNIMVQPALPSNLPTAQRQGCGARSGFLKVMNMKDVDVSIS